MKKIFLPFLFVGLIITVAFAGTPIKDKPIKTGADQTDKYLSYLKGKRVALLANPTTIVGDKHFVDSMLKKGVNIVKVFGPEHGFRGNASAGIKVADEVDPTSGVKVVSLYGPKRKPSKEDMADVDLMIFDIQDVGCRFYTYINVLSHIMEACAENGKELLILDRPNPNGYLVDGPILDMQFKSGIGMFPIPIAHGMTIGEFAQMINGEGWLPNKMQAKLKIIKVANYAHDMDYTLPVKPSPNLNTQQSIMLYPTTCLFEGTVLNHGRGTMFPFTIFGSPLYKGMYDFSFTPTSIKGMAETPLHMNKECFGLDLRNVDIAILKKKNRIQIQWMIDLYNKFPAKEQFFDRSQSNQIGDINKLIGNDIFRKQVAEGKSVEEIYASWEPGLSEYKTMRKKYLLYP
ncbi:MAG: hypothetical protein B7Y37_14035 [Sphingobacteriia bacterium 28-36-52]|nr:MAG: hypothetical protein B7Y37_14035 [Sphingobacteriia bacterium 28-36-52]